MEHIHNCGNCAHFDACNEIMKRYAGATGLAKDGTACGNYAVKLEDILGDDYDLAHLRELVQADREEKCLILPVKLGTHLFVRCKDREAPVVVESTVVGAHIKDTESYRGAPRKEYIVVRSNGFSKHIRVDQIGKTAFFSREEALTGKEISYE